MSKAFARLDASVTTLRPPPPVLELICRTDSLAALRAAVDHGADSIRLKWRDAPGVGQQEFQRAGLKKAVHYALEHGCTVCLELGTSSPERDSAHAVLTRAFESDIGEVSLSSPALALYLRTHHPSVGIRFMADEPLLSRRALALLYLRLGITRVALPRVVSLAQLQGLSGVPGIELEVQGCGAGCAIIAGRMPRASEDGKKTSGNHVSETPTEPCSDGEPASNDSGFAGSGHDSAASLTLLPELLQANARGVIVEAPSRSPARMAQITSDWREAIDRHLPPAAGAFCRLVSLQA